MVFVACGSWAQKVSTNAHKSDVAFTIKVMYEIAKVRLTLAGNKSDLPVITIDDDLMDPISEDWSSAIIMKIIGRIWNVEMLRVKLGLLWDSRGLFELLDVGVNLFIIHGLDQSRQEYILTGGSWKLAGRFLELRK